MRITKIFVVSLEEDVLAPVEMNLVQFAAMVHGSSTLVDFGKQYALFTDRNSADAFCEEFADTRRQIIELTEQLQSAWSKPFAL